MRTRKEILKEYAQPDKHIIELLLDIRDLLQKAGKAQKKQAKTKR